MGKYFKPFPTISYANTVCVDIIRSTKLSTQAQRESALYYEYEVPYGQRPDTISYDYYKNSYYDWLIYMSNGIVDPYYDWYLTNDTFESYIIDKYNSVANAIETVMYYQVNWFGDDRRLSASEYDALGYQIKKYWKPETDDAITYVRKDLDWKSATNMVIELNVTDPTIFTTGDYIHQVTGGVVVASGQVAYVGTTTIHIQHVEGTFDQTGDVAVVATGVSTTTFTTLGSVYTVIAYSIPLSEFAYWEKVSAYDYEEKLNNEKSTMKIIDNRYVAAIQQQHEAKIKQ